MMDTVEIRSLAAAHTRPLRQKVLRPGRPAEENIYPLDDHPLAIHLGAYHQGDLIGIASFFKEPAPQSEKSEAYRLRGMAVLPEWQGKGIGKKILGRGIEELRSRSAQELWCNARTTASDFYFTFGFQSDGAEFEIPGIGPHYLLRLALAVKPTV